MMIGLLILAMWIVAAASAAYLVHVGKRQERPPLPVPDFDDPFAVSDPDTTHANAA